MSDTAFAGRHTCDSPEWYTPAVFVEAARLVMGHIDLDPASHEEANRTIRAKTFYTAEDNGLVHAWAGNVFLNPPGGKDPQGKPLVPQFWRRLVAAWDAREIKQAIWIGYSLEQLQTLQISGHGSSPLSFTLCVPRRRIAFVENVAKRDLRIAKLAALGKDPNQDSQPSHANYISYLGDTPVIFESVFRAFGQVVVR